MLTEIYIFLQISNICSKEQVWKEWVKCAAS